MAKERAFDPRRLDVRAFATAGGALGGEWPQSGFERLVGCLLALPGDTGPLPLVWSAAGEQRRDLGAAAPQTWLHLNARGSVTLQCQRCLQPMGQPLAVDRWFRFVGDEDEAERLDEEIEDDVLALSHSFDLHALLEDELILALPLVPRHEACPQPLSVDAGADVVEAAEPSPFAALAALRRTPPAG
jgi:uncharacterized protein